MNDVTILLNPLDAELFRSYQQFHSTFQLLCERGVFDTKNGSVEINFNEHGVIGSIVKRETVYRQGK